MKSKGLISWISFQLFFLILIMIVTEGISQAANEDVNYLGINRSNLKAEIENYIEDHKDTTAAISVAVFQYGETIHQGYYSNENIDMGFDNSPDIVMEWGSVTKMLVWASVMQLVELEKIDLNEDISTYLPEGFLSNLKYNQPITMMNLMHHNAGWEEQMIDLFIPMGKQVAELEDVLKNSLPNQLYQPGTVVAYSNWGAGLAGYIVERVSGMSFSDYVHKNIFEPLGMKHTAILPTLEDNPWVDKQRGILKCYSTDLKELGTSRYQIPIYPAGMATGTLEDLVLFGKSMIPKEGENSKLFKNRETLNKFLSPTLFYHNKNSTPRNAHGLWIDKTEVLALGHGGNTFGCTANLQFDPISGVGLAVMTNQSGETNYNIGFQEMIFGKYPKPSNELLDTDISGVYFPARTIKKGGLRLYSFLQTMPILSEEDNSFYIPIVGMKIIPISSDSFLLDYGTSVGAGFISLDKDNLPILEIGIQDYLPKNTIAYFFEIFLIFILVLALIYSFYIIIRSIVRKIRRKPTELKKAEGILISICNIGLFLSFLYFGMNVLSFKSKNSIRFGLILCGIISLGILVCLIRSIIIFKELEQSKVKRRMLNTILCGVAMLLNSFYWQWFRFW